MKHFSTMILLAAAGIANAHQGHGLPGLSHWHASDTSLLLGIAAVAALGLWLVRRK